MNNKNRNYILFVITLCLFAITFIFLLFALIIAPILSLDEGSANFFVFLEECLRYLLISLPYYIFAVVYEINNKKQMNLLNNTDIRFFKVSRTWNIILAMVITIMILIVSGYICYWR